MNVLVFSDTHLTVPFEQEKYNFLVRLIKKADTVIINGDFWDGYLTDYKTFVRSSWVKLFPLLKEKHTVYVYGNHDKASFTNTNQVSQFSDIQTVVYRATIDGTTCVFQHGNRITPFFEELGFYHPPKIVISLLNFIEKIMTRVFRNKYIGLISQKYNNKMKRYAKKHLKPGELLFCGHTHCAEFDLQHQFVNTGFIRYGLAQYVWIRNGKVEFQEEWYE
ncbi:hypothetical protein HGA88_01010 [Candidatus Roizmanbacteria bacterium]|nr:hypothetical protein [Candidatus Roizmanbacteria bacterium]